MATEQRGVVPGAVALRATAVSKSFGGFRALVEAHLEVRRGTVHALLGGNGSGKSTLIKSLAGVYSADSGALQVSDTVVDLHSITPVSARQLGLRFVHQDLGLFSELSIAENIALARGYPTRWTMVRSRDLQREVKSVLERFEIDAAPSTPVGALRPSQRAMVAIARALHDADSAESVLLLDEPTAALAEHDAHELMTAIRNRADSGQTVILVSHRFTEITAVADDVTVFRDGRSVGTGSIQEMPIARVISLMTGGEAREMPPSLIEHAPGPETLHIRELCVGTARGVSLSVGEGEIVGFAGLDGAGQADVLAALFGLIPRDSGSVFFAGEPLNPASPRHAMKHGVAFIPQDRHTDAAFLDMSIVENLTVSILDRIWNGVALVARKERSLASTAIRRFGVRASSPEAPLGVLSGGNQQKVVLGRWMQRNPRLVLLMEPTQGVDVVARRDIYESVMEAARGGATILVASSDIDELLAITHRIVIFRRGRIVGTVGTAASGRDQITGVMMAEEPSA